MLGANGGIIRRVPINNVCSIFAFNKRALVRNGVSMTTFVFLPYNYDGHTLVKSLDGFKGEEPKDENFEPTLRTPFLIGTAQ